MSKANKNEISVTKSNAMRMGDFDELHCSLFVVNLVTRSWQRNSKWKTRGQPNIQSKSSTYKSRRKSLGSDCIPPMCVWLCESVQCPDNSIVETGITDLFTNSVTDAAMIMNGRNDFLNPSSVYTPAFHRGAES